MNSPVFVVGSVRSGTTIISKCLSSMEYQGFDEGHLFGLLIKPLESLDKQIDEYKRRFNFTNWAISSFPVHQLKTGMVKFFTDHCENRLGYNWYDKTPGPDQIRYLPYLVQLFPAAKVIYCERRGLDVVTSSMRRFGNNENDVEKYCEQWRDVLEAWDIVSSQMKGNAIVIRHEEILSNPAGVAEKLCRHLNRRDKISTVQEEICQNFPERTSKAFEQSDINYLEISEEAKNKIRSRLGFHMRKRGYSFESGAQAAVNSRKINFSLDERFVEIINLEDESYFKSLGGSAFLLHPPRNGKTEVIFRRIDVKSSEILRVVGRLCNEQSSSVRFGVAIEYENGISFEKYIDFDHDQYEALEFPIDQIQNVVNIRIWSAMTDENSTNAFAWMNVESIEIC